MEGTDISMDGRPLTDGPADGRTEERDWRSCSSAAAAKISYTHHGATRLLASSQGGGAVAAALPSYRQNMGIGFGPNLIPSGKLACQPANDRGKREAKCGIVAWSPTKRHRKATLEAGGLEMAVLLQNYNIVAPLHASGAPVEHTNFISTTLQIQI